MIAGEKKAAESVEQSPTAAEAKGAAANTVQGVDLIAQVKGVVKDVADAAEKNPVGARVIKAAKDVQAGLEKSPVTARMRQTMQETAETVQKSPLLDAAHKVLLAGVGAAALAQEEVEEFVNRLVERGQIAEADGKKLLGEVLEKRRQTIRAQASRAVQRRVDTGDLEKHIEEVIGNMNLPTKDEIEALGAKITALTKKVDELKKSA